MTLPLYSKEGQVQVDLEVSSMVFVCRVLEGAAVAWMDLNLVMELEEPRAPLMSLIALTLDR